MGSLPHLHRLLELSVLGWKEEQPVWVTDLALTVRDQDCSVSTYSSRRPSGHPSPELMVWASFSSCGKACLELVLLVLILV